MSTLFLVVAPISSLAAQEMFLSETGPCPVKSRPLTKSECASHFESTLNYDVGDGANAQSGDHAEFWRHGCFNTKSTESDGNPFWNEATSDGTDGYMYCMPTQTTSTFSKPYQVPLASEGWCSHEGAIRQDVPGCGIVCSDATRRGMLKKNIWWEDVPCSLCPGAEWEGCPIPTHKRSEAEIVSTATQEWQGRPRIIVSCRSNYGNDGDVGACRKAYDPDLQQDFFFNGFFEEVSAANEGMARIEFSLQEENPAYDTVGGLIIQSGRFGTYALTRFDLSFQVHTDAGLVWTSPQNMKVVNKLSGQRNGQATVVGGGTVTAVTYTAEQDDTGLVLSFDTLQDVVALRMDVHRSDRSVQPGFYEAVLVHVNVLSDHPHVTYDGDGTTGDIGSETFDEFVSATVLPYQCQPEFCDRWDCNGEVSWCSCWRDNIDYPKCVDTGDAACNCD